MEPSIFLQSKSLAISNTSLVCRRSSKFIYTILELYNQLGDNLAEVSPSYHAFREGFRNGLSNLGDNFAYANAHFSDDFSRSGARVYNASDDVARGMKEVAEQAGKHSKEEFVEKAVENVSRDLSEPQSRFIGKLRGEDVTLP